MADLHDEQAQHDWYFDSWAQSPKMGRLCRRCRFREVRDGINGKPCSGDARLYDGAFADGKSYGTRTERERMRAVLGL